MIDKNRELENTSSDTQHIDSVEMIDSLQSGLYWRSKVEIEGFNIPANTVLLIKSIRYVDGYYHTIILRPHPSVGRYGPKEHRFLVDEFLEQFEYEPNHEAIRNAEIANIHSKVDELNAELLEAQSDGSILEEHVKTELDKRNQKESNNPDNLPAVVDPGLIPTNVSGAMSSELSERSVDTLKLMAERHGDVAKIKANWIQSKTQEIASTLEAVAPYYEERAAAALAATEDVMNGVNKMQRGIETLYLYTGKDVSVEQICSGKDAPYDSPLSVCSQKLFVDEELSIFLDVHDWFDFADVSKFDEALKQYPALVNQIFPTDRCILVMAFKRRDINYGDLWINSHRNERNKAVFLMVRNGENVYRIYSPVESHLGAARLFPTVKESDSFFKGFDLKNISFNDVAYTDSLKSHELMALHYKRWLILVAGLDAREKLFGEFYPQSLVDRFVSLEFQRKYMQFIDDESNVLDDDKPNFVYWLKSRNKFLRSGSRVLVDYRRILTVESAPGAFSYSGRMGEYSFNYDFPEDKWGLHIVFHKKGKCFIKVELSGQSYSTGRKITRNIYVDLSLFQEGSEAYYRNSVPFLCLDRVNEEDLTYYINNRQSREYHLSYIRLFKDAKRLIDSETKASAGIRNRLLEALIEGKIVDSLVEANPILKEAIYTWRSYNRGKPITEIKEGSKEWGQLLDVAYFYASKDSFTDKILNASANIHGKPLRVVITGLGSFYLYHEEDPSKFDNRLTQHCWVLKSKIRLNKTKAPGFEASKWANLPKHHAGEIIIWESSNASKWTSLSNAFGSFQKKTDMFSVINRWKENPISAIANEKGQINHEFIENAIRFYKKLQYKGNYVLFSDIHIPIGLGINKYNKKVYYICIQTESALPYLYAKTNDEQQKTKLKESYLYYFAHKNVAEKRFDLHVKRYKEYEISIVKFSDFDINNPFSKKHSNQTVISKENESLSQALDRIFVKRDRRYFNFGDRFIFADDIREEGFELVDRVFK